MARLALFALLLSIAPGCLAGAVPPSRTDFATLATTSPDGQLVGGTRFATGVHSAGFVKNPDNRLDVGGGYVYERKDVVQDDPSGYRARPTPDAPGVDPDRQGLYAEIATRIVGGPNWRTWLGVRGDVLFDDTLGKGRPTTGMSARLYWELFGHVEGAGGSSGGCGAGFGVAYGGMGIGAYLESGYRNDAETGSAFVATAGVTVRLPFLAGVGVSTCGWIR